MTYLRLIFDAETWAEPKVTYIKGERVAVFEIKDAFALHQGIDKDQPILLDVRAIPSKEWDVVTVEASNA